MTMLLQLFVNRLPIRLGPWLPRTHRHGLVSKQFVFQFGFAQVFRQRPADPGSGRSFQIVVHRAQADRATACDLPLS
jgi:hypothetical protein